VRIRAVDAGDVRERPDRLVTEEPMEIRVQPPHGEAVPIAVTMRTPGNDFELAVGFLLTERVLTDPADIASVAYCLEGTGEQHYNVVTVATHGSPDLDLAQRAFAVSASCGICGATSLEALERHCAPVAPGPVIDRAVLTALPDRLRDEQTVFASTGGLHAAACFEPDGTLVALREDIGRHNALDKIIGHASLEGRLPLARTVLLVSGRVSFEIVQKAAIAGIPIVCAVSAPSSLAVDAATQLGQTVVGFLRDRRFNVYCGPERVELKA
jgi:FdhD protein